MNLFGPEPSPILDELKTLPIDELSPRKALETLYRWKESL